MGASGMKNPNNLKQNTPAARVIESEREDKVIEAVKRGMTYQQAAEYAGYTAAASALRAVRRVLARHAADIASSVNEYRALEVARLDRILLELSTVAFNRSTNPELRLKYLTAMDRNIQTRANLLGLNAPIQHEVFTHDALNLRISQLADELGLAVPERLLQLGSGPGAAGEAADSEGPATPEA